LQGKIDEIEDDDNDDKNNIGFEKLSEGENKVGLFVFKIRERFVRLIKEQKVRKDFSYPLTLFHFG
jgi:hypothetical protein